MITQLIGWVRNCYKQWSLNISVTGDFHGQVNASLVTNELKRIETRVNARIDALEVAIDDVMEKYVRKISARESREAKLLEAQKPQLNIDPYEEIKKRHMGE